jgi:3alpha(or 20beta)-hydroxysteroid dehydrogenase
MSNPGECSVRFAEKVALVTGASRGIGAETARMFVQEGAQVVLADIRPEEGQKLAQELGPAATYAQLDVTSAAEWTALIDDVCTRLGGIDILVNNAGIFFMRSLDDTSPEDFERIFRVNQLGPFLGMKTVAPYMRQRGGGVIVNMSSMSGLRGFANNMGYGATKWALRGMTKVAAHELGRDNIRVVSVHPGAVDTPMNHEQIGAQGLAMAATTNPLGRVAQPQEVAAMVLWLASPEAGFCTGSEFVIDGGATVS